MLPPFIIEQIRQREERNRQREHADQQPRLELPLEKGPMRGRDPDGAEEEDADRGVVVVDLLG